MIGLPMLTVVGTLTEDVQLRFTPAGVAVLSLNLACNERKFNKQTQAYEDGEATFLRVSLWRQAGENAAELTRGTRVIAIGVLKQRSFDDRDGNKRTVLEMEAEEVGPSSKFAVVSSVKASRASGSDYSSRGGQAEPSFSAPVGGGSSDPWGAQEPDPPF